MGSPSPRCSSARPGRTAWPTSVRDNRSADQVTVGTVLRRQQRPPPAAARIHQPAAEPGAQVLRVTGEDQGEPSLLPVRIRSRSSPAAAQSRNTGGIVDHHQTAPADPAERLGELRLPDVGTGEDRHHSRRAGQVPQRRRTRREHHHLLPAVERRPGHRHQHRAPAGTGRARRCRTPARRCPGPGRTPVSWSPPTPAEQPTVAGRGRSAGHAASSKPIRLRQHVDPERRALRRYVGVPAAASAADPAQLGRLGLAARRPPPAARTGARYRSRSGSPGPGHLVGQLARVQRRSARSRPCPASGARSCPRPARPSGR